MPAVEVDAIAVNYGSLRAVDGLSFAAEAGQVLALLGRNGAGKTTTVECCEGLRNVDHGEVRVLGHDPKSERATLAPKLGAMLQEGGLYPVLSPRRALRLCARYYAQPLDPEALLDRLELRAVQNTQAKRLSGGERQRLALGLALIGRPEVIFLDEPTAGVDPNGRVIIRSIIEELKNDGVTVILTSHDLSEVERVADQVVIVDKGRALATGSIDELTNDATVTFSAVAGLDLAELGRVTGARVDEPTAGRYIVVGAAGTPAIAAIAGFFAERQIELSEIHAGRQRLEDVFIALTNRSCDDPSEPQ